MFQKVKPIVLLLILVVSKPSHSNGIIEMALFQVDEKAMPGYLDARHKTMQAIQTYPGFKMALSFQAQDNPNQILDFVIWDNYESAFSAAHQVMQDQRAMDMMRRIKSIQFYGHADFISALTHPNQIDEKAQLLNLRLFGLDKRAIDSFKAKIGNWKSCMYNKGSVFASRSNFVNEPSTFVPPEMLKGESTQYFIEFVQWPMDTEKSDCDEKKLTLLHDVAQLKMQRFGRAYFTPETP